MSIKCALKHEHEIQMPVTWGRYIVRKLSDLHPRAGPE